MLSFAHRTWVSWVSVAAVALLCTVLGFLQYRWLGEVSMAERGRLHGELQYQIINLSRAFNQEIYDATRAAQPGASSPVFRNVVLTKTWPPHSPDAAPVLTRFYNFSDGTPTWLVAELNVAWTHDRILPGLLARYLAAPGLADYDIEVATKGPNASLIYSSDSLEKQVWSQPDASTSILDTGGEGPPGEHHGPPPDSPGARRGPPPDGSGRWRLLARRRSGSLEALVAGAQRRNLAVSAAILFLIVGIAAVLVRLTRRAHLLADAQIGFVAGVSHELRTPLTVIRTAAFNLTNGKIQNRPEQIERYGRLIAGESEKLEGLIDQVLRFASGRAGHAIRERAPVAIASLIEEEIGAFEGKAGLVVDRKIAPNLPDALGDKLALHQALRNLLDNAVRYGGGWIGIYAKPVTAKGVTEVEIEVADRGPGIPAEERGRVFEPFFRGSRAVRDQIHGTGLGLNIVRTIARAHGGSVDVTSEPGSGTHFFLRIPCVENPNADAHSAD